MEGLFTVVPAGVVFILGAAIGSFLNVVIYRLPAGLSLLHPPSRCPHCRRRLKKYDNVPVLGWLWLRGRCRFCHNPISVRYPIVEAATGGLFVLVFLQFNLPLPTVGYWLFLSLLLVLSLIDLDTMTLPDSLTKAGVISGLLFQALWGWSIGGASGLVQQLLLGIVGAVLGIWLFDSITLAGTVAFGQPAMGGGDAKLAAMMGAWLGWKSLLLAVFLACAIGAFTGGGAIALGWLKRRQVMPFGPFLALGALMSALWGQAMISTYVRIFFPTLWGG